MGGVQTIELSEPITAHGEQVSVLTLRPPKARDLRELPLKAEMKMGDLFAVSAACADIPQSSFDQLAASDLMRVVEVVGGFLGVGTGVKPLS